jgi:hypothetical protein
MVVDLELGGDAEVALAPGREADVARMRETLNVRMSLRSRSWPTTYQPRASR